MKKALIGLVIIVVGYSVFFEIYFFNDWEQAETILPEESIDELSLKEFFDWQGLPIFKLGNYVQQGSDERKAKDYVFHFPLGFEFSVPDKYNPLRWSENDDALNFICLGKNSRIDLSGFFTAHFDEEICEEEYVQGAVMARFEGSGRMVRFWMTVGSAVVNLVDNEVFRVYVDDQPEPLIQVALKDVFSGQAGEMFAPPFGAADYTYVAWYYPIAFHSKLIIAVDQLGPSDLYYHQTDVVLDDVSITSDVPLTRVVPGSALAFREEVKARLNSDAKHLSQGSGVLFESSQVALPSGVVKEFVLSGASTIESFSIEVSEVYVEQLNATNLRIYWDENSAPAFDMSVGDLFSTSFDQDFRSKGPIAVSRKDGKIVYALKLPMPFNTQARVELVNNAEDFVLNTIKFVGTKTVPIHEWGYLHAKASLIKAPAELADHPVLDVSGTGRLVGMCAQLWGKGGEGFGSHLPYSFLEGDEMIWIDGEKGVQGTGTEDYFNSSFYYLHDYKDELFAQVWGKVNGSEEGERVSQCRWHILSDVIDFKESLKFDLEVGGRNPNAVLDYRTTAFYYLE